MQWFPKLLNHIIITQQIKTKINKKKSMRFECYQKIKTTIELFEITITISGINILTRSKKKFIACSSLVTWYWTHILVANICPIGINIGVLYDCVCQKIFTLLISNKFPGLTTIPVTFCLSMRCSYSTFPNSLVCAYLRR